MFLINLFFVFTLLFFNPIESGKKNVTPVHLHLETIIKSTDNIILGRFGGATITKTGEILYTDTDTDQKTVLVFNNQGKYVTRFGREGRGPGEFQTPRAVETDTEGFIYVVDGRSARITIWDSNYNYVSEIPYRSGWGTQFIKNSDSLFIFTKPFAPLENGFDAVVFSKIDRENRETLPFFTYEIRDWFDENRWFNSSSKVAITDTKHIISSGKSDKYLLRKIHTNGNLVKEFGKPVNPVYYSQEEMELRIDMAYSVNPEFASMVANGRKYKHIYSNLGICGQNWLWVHRNKEHKAVDEIDIYTVEGQLKTMLTLPDINHEMQMAGIYNDKILFHGTNNMGEEFLHVYRIEYGE